MAKQKDNIRTFMKDMDLGSEAISRANKHWQDPTATPTNTEKMHQVN